MSEQNPLEPLLWKLGRIAVASKPQIIREIGEDAIRFIADNFASESWRGAVTKKWDERQKKDKGPRRAILYDKGFLSRSFKQHNGTNTVTISTDIPYARAHNEGETISIPSRSVILNYRGKKGGKLALTAVRTETQQRKVKTIRRAQTGDYSISMPERRFMGPSPVYDRMAQKTIVEIIMSKIKSL